MISFAIPIETQSQKHRASGHWAVRARARKRLREATALCWKNQLGIGRHAGERTNNFRWLVSLTRVSPRGKFLDDDNLRYVLKPVRDEIAKQLGVDDGPKGPVEWEYHQGRGEWGVEVILARKEQ